MVNKGKNKRKTRKNPMLGSQQRKFGRPKVSFDGTTVMASLFSNATITASNLGADYVLVSCDSTNGMNRGVAQITDCYQEYKYLQASVEWLPIVGPADADAASRVYMAYIDNPEEIVAYIGATNAARGGYIKTVANVQTWNAWERHTYNIPLRYRRKIFAVNTATGAANKDDLDQDCQGAVIIYYESITAAVILGTLKLNSRTQLTGLQVNPGT